MRRPGPLSARASRRPPGRHRPTVRLAAAGCSHMATATQQEAPHTGRDTDTPSSSSVHPYTFRTPIASSRRRKICCPPSFARTCHKGWLPDCASGRIVSASLCCSLYDSSSAPMGTGRTLAAGTGTCGGTTVGCSPLAWAHSSRACCLRWRCSKKPTACSNPCRVLGKTPALLKLVRQRHGTLLVVRRRSRART